MGIWKLYRVGTQFQQRPSEVFGIRANPWLAWQFDNAVLTFGTWVQNRLDARDEDNRPKYSFESALGLPIQPKKISRAAMMNMPGAKIS